ncbi:MAG: thermonuclease family protein [Akkermansiaceae bacterium]|nr:thermonuclease family protein [Akkermansiaceae bacterium]
MLECTCPMLTTVRTVLTFMLLAASLLRAETIVGKCTDVADGDTLTLTLPDKSTEKIRLYGIDAPERQQDYAEEAKQRLSELTAGKEVRAEVMNRDRYGRAVARVYTGKTDVSLAMVSGGCAWHYVIYAPLDIELAEAEALASAQKWGLWQHPHPIAPWEFRKGARPAKPNEHNYPYWVTESGRVHNARCKYFGTTQNGRYTAQPQMSATDCNLCGGTATEEQPTFPTWWNMLLLILLLGLLPLVLLRLLIIRARKH